VEHAAALWPSADDYQRLRRVMALAATEQYREEGAGGTALELLVEGWKSKEVARIIRFSRPVRMECLTRRGCALLAAAAVAGPGRRDELLREVDRHASALPDTGFTAARWCSASLRAGAAAARGDREGAALLLAEAEAGFAAAGWRMAACTARRRLGEVRGGDAGQALVAAADAEMTAEGILSPARITALYLPGKW
jgi:hypothetical protein